MSYQKYSRFSPAAYEACDNTGKLIVIQYLNKQGIFALAEERYSNADVKGLIPTTKIEYDEIYVEVEIKSGWIGDWPESFKTVDIPYRKMKLLDKHPVDKLFFMVISGDLKQAWRVPASVIDEAHVGRKDTTRKDNEEFIRVPLNLCYLIDLEGFTNDACKTE